MWKHKTWNYANATFMRGIGDMTGRKHSGLWVVLADGEHARVVSPVAEHQQFSTRTALDSITAHLRAHDLGTDRPGRTVESTGTLRHAISPRQDLHQAAKHVFVVEVAKSVNTAADNNVFDRLVLVAPGHALHDLKEALTPQARSKVVGTLEKDLTKVPDSDLARHLGEWWLLPEEGAG